MGTSGERERRELLKCFSKEEEPAAGCTRGRHQHPSPRNPNLPPSPSLVSPFPYSEPTTLLPQRFLLNACSNVNVANITAHISSTTKKTHHITHTDTHRSTPERFAHMQLKGVAFISFIDY